MAAAAGPQALRFLVAGGGGAGAGSFDACNPILSDLCTTGNPKVSRFSHYMKIAFEGKRDKRILVLASNVLGHLARAGGAMAADEMELKSRSGLALWGQSGASFSGCCFDLERNG